jgi:glycerol kinase
MGAHLSRALLEGLSFQNKLIFKAMQKDFGSKLKSVYVDGGASQSDVFMQIQSDLSGEILKRPKSIETTAMGAAFVAGIGAGVLNKNVGRFNPVNKRFKPAKQNSADLKSLLLEYESLFKALCSKPF